ncbi:MAG: hypothetical protein RIS41_1713 [Actinomycetota bacterium]
MRPGPPRLRRRTKIGGEGSPEVFCADEQNEMAIDLERWQTLARRVLESEGVRGGTELSVFFVSSDEMAALNAEHMGATGPTDVLSFPIDGGAVVEVDLGGGSRGPDRPEPDRSDLPVLLGDVVICPGVARAQAPVHAGNLDDELALLVVHGVLHVLGWDHRDDQERAAMWQRQRDLLIEHHWHGPAPDSYRADLEDHPS